LRCANRDEYLSLDETIDSAESRYCSSGQQELYKFVNGLLTQDLDLDPVVFKEQIDRKLQEVLPLLKTEEGKIALEAYIQAVSKISNNSLGMKLLLLFKKCQLNDYSTLRSVSNIIAQIINLRQKYAAQEYRLPKEFNTEVSGLALYEKYKDSFHLITPPKPSTTIAPGLETI